jgi:CHAT domain-containing protein
VRSSHTRQYISRRRSKCLSHFVIGILLSSSLVYFVGSVSIPSLAQSNDADAIRNQVGSLFKLYQQKELDQLLSLFSKKSPYRADNKKILQSEFTLNTKIVVKGFDIHKMEIEGEQAILRVVVDMAITRADMVTAVEKLEKQNWIIRLVNEAGDWKAFKFMRSEEELTEAIIKADTEEERNALLENEPELITSYLVSSLIRQNYLPSFYGSHYQTGLATIRVLTELYKQGKKPEELLQEQDLIFQETRKIYTPPRNFGNYIFALAINQLASRLAERLGDQSLMASVMSNLGYIYGWLGTPDKSPELALDYFQKSLKIAEEFGLKAIMARSLIDSALVHESLGELTPAGEYYQRGLKLAEELGLHEMTVIAINNLGIIHRLRGDFAKALECWLKGLKLTESWLESGSEWRRLSMYLLNVGDAFAFQGNFQQASAYHKRGVEAAEKAFDLGFPFTSFYERDASALAIIGRNYDEQRYDRSMVDFLQMGLRHAEERDNPPLISKFSPAARLGSIVITEDGETLTKQNNISDAINRYQLAINLAEKEGDKTGMSRPLWGLGKISLLRGEYREALTYFERAIEAEENTKQPYICEVLVAVAQVYLKLGQREEARKSLVKAIAITEELREHVAGSELDRTLFFENAVAPYRMMIDLLIDQEQNSDAFSYAQRAKGRTLLELLQNGRGNVTKSATPAEREKEQQLNRKIVSLNRQITGERLKSQPDEKRMAEVEEQLKKARLEFEAFQTTLYAAHPELKIHRGDIRPVSFDDASSLIPDSKSALLDFIVTDQNVHLFVLTKDAPAQPALHTYTIRIERKSLTEKVERYRGRMDNRDYDFHGLSKELYLLLIKPAQKQLQGKTNLIISPDNVLWNLPFQTLLSPELRYLIEDAAISYAPSLSVLREMHLAHKKKQTPAKASILALGNPALGTRSKELAKFVKMDAELQPLPEAAAQVRALERLYGKTLSRVYTGTAAREELVKKQSARYRILHLATHGILNDVSPIYSHVLLSQTPGKNDEDGLLEAWEMMNLDLNTDLVVLAACETARGRAGAGEGVIGMSWALFVAGCPRTVVSQWNVEASSTTALMVEFHKRFKTRYGATKSAVSTAESMRQAALKVMNNPEYAHPFYWGGFVVVGDGN